MTLDETKEAQGVATSETTKGTSEKDPETLTDEEKVTKAVSDALSAAGRTAKDTDAKLAKAIEIASKTEKLQAEMKVDRKKKAEQDYQDELAKADGEPTTIKNIKLARDNRELMDKLGDAEAKSKQKDDKILQLEEKEAVSTKEQNARVIASKYEVNIETLRLTDGSVEAMEALAKTLSGKVIPTLKPNGSKTIGGSASFEKIRDEMIKNPSNDAKMKRYLEAKKAREG